MAPPGILSTSRSIRRPLRALLLAFLVVLVWAPSASAAVTQKQAASRAVDALGSDEGNAAVIVFGLPKPIRAGTKVTQAGTTKPAAGSSKGLNAKLRSAGVRAVKAPSVLRARTRSYFFYEDRGPFQLYQHPGRVALVDVQTGKVTVSRTISWPPLVNGRLPAFLKSAGAYRSSKYRVFYNAWTLPGAQQQPRTANRNLFDQDPFGPGRPLPSLANSKTIANRLAAERSCALRVTDTLPSFWNANELNLTRSYVGTLFEQLERDNSGFIDDRYGARTGESLAKSLDRLMDAGCKDILLYIAGQGYSSGGEPVIQLGTSVMKGGMVAQQNISATDLRTLISGRSGVTFKLKIDAPYAGGVVDRLKDLQNVLLIETPAAAGDEAFAFIPEVQNSQGQMVTSTPNPAGLLEFTNCELVGLKAFFDSAEEIDKATQGQNEGVSFLVEMLARGQELCNGNGGFADDMGASPQLYAQKRASGRGTNLPPKANPQDVAAVEDTPKAITLTGSDPDNDPLTFTITKNPDHGTLSGTPPNVTYTPAANYVGPDDFSFKVEDDEGASNTAKVDITVAAANDAPVVTTSAGNTAYTEQAASVVVDGSLTVSDIDDTQLDSATVAITSGFQSGDELVFADQLGITGTYNSGTGVLTLTTPSGEVSVSDMQTALRDVRFRNNTNNNPSTPKTIQFKANDGSTDSAGANKNVAVTGVNDNPVLTTTGSTLAYTEGDGEVAVDPGLTAADPDSTNLVGATVQITGNHVQAEDELTFTNQNGITHGYNDATGTLTLSGAATVANYQAALRSVKYVNSENNPNTTNRTVSFRVDDGGAANNLSNIATRDVSVANSNDAPVVTTSGGSTSYTEGDPLTTVDGSVTVTDADDTKLNTGEVRVSAATFQAGDTLSFTNTANIQGSYNSGTGVLTIDTDAAGDPEADVAEWQTFLQSIKYSHTGDNPAATKAIQFKVNDGTTDSAVATKNINITGVNDGATLTTTALALGYTENDGAVAIDNGLTLDDPEDNLIVNAEVKISSNHVQAEDELSFVNISNGTTNISGSYNDSTGTLTLTGTETEAEFQDALRSVKYQNISDNPTTTTRTISFQTLGDNGAPSQPSNTATRDITISSGNDAPVVDTSAGATSYTEGDPAVTIDGAVTVTDADDTKLNTGEVRVSAATFQSGDELQFTNTANIQGSYNSGTGVLTIDTDAAGDPEADVAEWQTFLQSIKYTTTNDNPTSKSVEFKVNDGSLDSATDTKTINITGQNDGAVLTTTVAAHNYSEGDGAVAADPGLTLDDPENNLIVNAEVKISTNHVQAEDELSFVNISNGTTNISGSYDDASGTLTLTGTETEAEFQDALRSVKYENVNTDNPTASTRTLSFKTLGDDGTPSTGSNTATRDINVARVNDAPVITPNNSGVAYTEGQASPVTLDNTTTVTDVDDTKLNTGEVAITSGFQTGDVLGFTNTANIQGSYAPGTGILTIDTDAAGDPEADIAEWETFLRSITYSTTNGNPVASKTVQFKVNDGTSDSNTPTKEITVTPTNSPPVFANGGTLNYTEGAGAVFTTSTLTLTEPEGDSITGGSATISGNYQSGEDSLSWSDNDTITDSIVVSGPASGQTITLTGTGTATQYQEALKAIKYTNSSEAPSTLQRTVTYSATDNGTPTAATGQGTSTINITSVDDQPVANDDPGGDVSTAETTVDEDALATNIPVMENDTDVDGGPKSIVAVTQPTDGTVAITGGGTGLTYKPNANFCGTSDTFTYNLNGPDGVGTGDSATVSMTVTCVNDNPVADDETFNGNDSAHGNTTMVVDDPTDSPAADPAHPNSTVTGDILAGDNDNADSPPGTLIVLSAGADAGATDGKTADDGRVTIEADGDFVFHPKAETSCTDTSDSFNYKISDQNGTGPGPTPGTDIGTVTIAISGCVWYVNNNFSGTPDNEGTARAPFDTLQSAETKSAADHTVFVHDGTNDTTGYAPGYAMDAREHLIGEHEGLTVDPDRATSGPLTPDVLQTATPNAHPTLTATGEDVIALDDKNEVRGFNIDPNGAGGIAAAAGDIDGGVIDDVNVDDNGTAGTEPGLDIDAARGTFDVTDFTYENNGVPSSAPGVRVSGAVTPADTQVNFGTGDAPEPTKINKTGGQALFVLGAGMGTSLFDEITVSGSTSGGIELTNVTAGSSTTFGDGVGTDLDLATVAGNTASAFRISSGSGVTVPSGGTANVAAIGGPAIDVTSTSGATLNFDDVSSTSSTGDGINLAGLGAGTFTAAAGANTFVTGAQGISFDLDGGTGAVTFPGALNDGSGAAIEVTSRGAGATTTLNGAISDDNDIGGGITVSGNSGGTTSIGNGQKQVNTTTAGSPTQNNAVVYTGNTSHTLNLTGGGLDIDTGTGSGVDASSNTSSTLVISGGSNSINTVSGRPLRVQNTTIGANDVVFQAITATSAPPNGILIDNVGNTGNLVVNGDGDANADGGGGTITNATGDAISLDGTSTPEIRDMNLVNAGRHGLSAGDTATVDGLTIEKTNISDSGDVAGTEHGVYLEQITGTVNATGPGVISDSEGNAFHVEPSTGTRTVTIDDYDMNGKNPTGQHGVSIQPLGGTTTTTVKNGQFEDFDGTGVQSISGTTGGGSTNNTTKVHNNHFEDNTAHHVDIGAAQLGATTFNVHDNTFLRIGVDAPTASELNASVHYVSSGASIVNTNPLPQINGRISNNTIGTAATADSGAIDGKGIFLEIRGDFDARIEVNNNQIHHVDGRGVDVIASLDGLPFENVDAIRGELDLTVHNNAVTSMDNTVGRPRLDGMTFEGQDTYDVCVDLLNNSAPTGQGVALTGRSYRLTPFLSSSFRLPGYGGGAADDAAVEAYVVARPNASTADAQDSGPWSNAGASCQTPTGLP